jgi:hypothetical protein
MPWRNGGGTTRELWADTWQNTANIAWDIRISVANIDSNRSFSVFEGVERWFTILAGAPLELTIDGHSQTIAKGDPPIRFDGSVATHCQLGAGSTSDLNLMTRTAGVMKLIESDQPWLPKLLQAGLFTAEPGVLEWQDGGVPGVQTVTVSEQVLVWFRRAPIKMNFKTSDAKKIPGWWMAAT